MLYDWLCMWPWPFYFFSLKVVPRSCQPWRRSLRGWGRQGTALTRTCTRPPSSVWQTGPWWSDLPPPRWVIDWKTGGGGDSLHRGFFIQGILPNRHQWVIDWKTQGILPNRNQWVIESEWETYLEIYYIVVQKNNLCKFVQTAIWVPDKLLYVCEIIPTRF